MKRNGLFYFVLSILYAAFMVSLSHALTLDTIADLVLGQDDFTSNTSNGGGGSVNSAGFNSPIAVAIDRSVSPNRVYVADFNNNRVLGWASVASLYNGATADLVIGQEDFFSRLCNRGGAPTGADTLCSPQGMAVDSPGNLYVADRGNSRVLVFFTPFTTDTTADRVLGQGNLTSSGCSNPTFTDAGAGSLCDPFAVDVDSAGNVYVADLANNRVVEYNVPLTTDTVADRVFGQTNFTSRTAGSGAGGLNQPNGVAVDTAGNLYVADFQNNRVLEYNTPLTTDTVADRVFGQSNFSSTSQNAGGISARSLYNPSGVVVDSAGNLYVADRSNRRVLEYNMPLTTDTVADRVFGQLDSFTTVQCNKGGVSASSLCIPTGIALDEMRNLWVADFANHRVLEYDTPVPPAPTTTTTTSTTTTTTSTSTTIPDATTSTTTTSTTTSTSTTIPGATTSTTSTSTTIPGATTSTTSTSTSTTTTSTTIPTADHAIAHIHFEELSASAGFSEKGSEKCSLQNKVEFSFEQTPGDPSSGVGGHTTSDIHSPSVMVTMTFPDNFVASYGPGSGKKEHHKTPHALGYVTEFEVRFDCATMEAHVGLSQNVTINASGQLKDGHSFSGSAVLATHN